MGEAGVKAGTSEDVSIQLKFFSCSVGVGGVKGRTAAAGEAAALVRHHSTIVNGGVLRAIVTFPRDVGRRLVEKAQAGHVEFDAWYRQKRRWHVLSGLSGSECVGSVDCADSDCAPSVVGCLCGDRNCVVGGSRWRCRCL